MIKVEFLIEQVPGPPGGSGLSISAARGEHEATPLEKSAMLALFELAKEVPTLLKASHSILNTGKSGEQEALARLKAAEDKL